MEAFSLLKYWRVGSNGGSGNGGVKTTEKQQLQQPITTTIATTVSEMSIEEEEECVVDGDGDGVEDEGPFFDLEFAVPQEEEEEEEKDECDDGDSVTDDDEEDEDGFDFTVSPDSVSSGGNEIDSSSSSPNNLTFSPSDDIFFKGDDGTSVPPLLLQSSPSPSSSTTSTSSSSVENSTNPKVQFPVSFIKTATRIRVFMLGFKSSNSNKLKTEDQNREKTEQKQSCIKTEQKQSKKFVTVKFRVEEILQVISLFARDSSSSSSSNNKIISSQEEIEEDEEKKLITKDFVQKYLKMIKPLYVRVSKRYNNGGAFSPSRSMSSSLIPSSPLKIETEEPFSSKNLRKQGVSNLPNGLRIVKKHLGKSRSASSVNPVTATTNSSGMQAKRRDDSLLEQQDGIQSAILHCKRSFNASRDTDSCPRSSSREESHEISIDSTRNSIDEAKK